MITTYFFNPLCKASNNAMSEEISSLTTNLTTCQKEHYVCQQENVVYSAALNKFFTEESELTKLFLTKFNENERAIIIEFLGILEEFRKTRLGLKLAEARGDVQEGEIQNLKQQIASLEKNLNKTEWVTSKI